MLKIVRKTGHPCVTPISIRNGRPNNFLDFVTFFCLSHYRCSNFFILGQRPYPLMIYMHIPLSKESQDFPSYRNTWKSGLLNIPVSCWAIFASVVAIPASLSCMKPCKASYKVMAARNQLSIINVQTFQITSTRPIPM